MRPAGDAVGWLPTVVSTAGWTPQQDGGDDPFWPEPSLDDHRPEQASGSVGTTRGGQAGSEPGGPAAPLPASSARALVAAPGRAPAAVAMHTAEPPVPEPAGPPPGLAPAHPSSVIALVRGGRLDLGRRGVVALAALGLLAALLSGVLLLRSRPSVQPVAVPTAVGAAPGRPAVPATAGAASVVVAVGGRVRRPGLVHLAAGSRIDDAVRAAGGALPGVDTGLLNLARKLLDGEQVLVGIAPVAGGPASAVAGAAAGAGSLPGAVAALDLNAAAVGDFDGLPGIGPVLAQRLVDWRTQHGRFASVDQLREVSGIGESKYQLLKAKVRV